MPKYGFKVERKSTPKVKSKLFNVVKGEIGPTGNLLPPLEKVSGDLSYEQACELCRRLKEEARKTPSRVRGE